MRDWLATTYVGDGFAGLEYTPRFGLELDSGRRIRLLVLLQYVSNAAVLLFFQLSDSHLLTQLLVVSFDLVHVF